jgi:hypothetical protein
MASATAKATAMGMRRIGIATAMAMLTVMAMATAMVMATVKAMMIEWQQLATMMVMVMPTA